jgi:peptidylprolyl isomerase
MLALLAAVALLALAVAACGDDDEDVGDDESLATTAPAAATTAPAGETSQPSNCPAPSGEAPVPDLNKQYDAAPEMTIDPAKLYDATVHTVRGDFVIRLRPDLAPQHVNSFVFLSREGFYNGVTFHRVLPGFVAQAGDPTGTGSGGPGYSIPAEFQDEVGFIRGVIGAARSQDPNSAGSQWFVTTGDASHLNGQYTVFGEVTSGMEIVDCLTARDPATDPTAPAGDAIISIDIAES